MEQMTAADIERQVFELEEIRVVIRAPKNELLDPYNFRRKASASTRITEWYSKRLQPLLRTYEAEIIDGRGNIPHGRINIETVRNSYA